MSPFWHSTVSDTQMEFPHIDYSKEDSILIINSVHLANMEQGYNYYMLLRKIAIHRVTYMPTSLCKLSIPCTNKHYQHCDIYFYICSHISIPYKLTFSFATNSSIFTMDTVMNGSGLAVY